MAGLLFLFMFQSITKSWQICSMVNHSDEKDIALSNKNDPSNCSVENYLDNTNSCLPPPDNVRQTKPSRQVERHLAPSIKSL